MCFYVHDEDKQKYVNDGFESMNGDIVVTFKGSSVDVNCSNNNTLLKDTEWFKQNRVCENWSN